MMYRRDLSRLMIMVRIRRIIRIGDAMNRVCTDGDDVETRFIASNYNSENKEDYQNRRRDESRLYG
ncbi:hypothetical protein D3C85_1800000 [compost metagenome]